MYLFSYSSTGFNSTFLVSGSWAVRLVDFTREKNN